jgi:hypothetical protein
MFIDGGLHKVFAAPEEPNVADSNRRLQHVAPPELSRAVAAKPRCDSVSLWPKSNLSTVCQEES